MLVELGVVEQRYRAVLEVLDEGVPVTDVARRYGVARQTVHGWLRRYANEGGLGGLADRSSRPESCPHQMLPEVEARIVGLRRAHPSWGPPRLRRAPGRRPGQDADPGCPPEHRERRHLSLVPPADVGPDQAAPEVRHRLADCHQRPSVSECGSPWPAS